MKNKVDDRTILIRTEDFPSPGTVHHRAKLNSLLSYAINLLEEVLINFIKPTNGKIDFPVEVFNQADSPSRDGKNFLILVKRKKESMGMSKETGTEEHLQI